MKPSGVLLRVASTSTPGRYYAVFICADTGDIQCQCNGKLNEICSHVDAVILCGERAMVHPEDLEAVPAAIRLYRGAVHIPDTWRTSWQNDIEWRGLEARRFGQKVSNSQNQLAPKMVCFTGSGPKPRDELRLEAKNAGWDVIDSPSARTTVLVCPSVDEVNRKTIAAKKAGTSLMSYEQWAITLLTGEVERPS